MRLKNCKTLITGGAGFIGSHIADRLIREGAHVRIIDNLSTGLIKNVPTAAEYIRGDICDDNLVARSLEGIDIVFHEAAQINPAKAVKNPLYDFNVNAGGTLKLLLAAKAAGTRRFIMASTNVYGNAGKSKMPESFPTLFEKESLLSPYAAAKICSEAYLKVANDELGLPTVRLRYFNVYGPRQGTASGSGVIALFTENAVMGKPLTIYGSGNQTRDFVYIDDVVEANILACKRQKAAGSVFNVGTGEETTINELAKLVSEVAGVEQKIISVGSRAADFRSARADISLASEVLGFTPKTTLRKGLKKYILWYKEECGTN